MSHPVTLFKLHGTGNDFAIAEAGVFADPETMATRVCDRHRGVGADGLIIVDRSVDGFDAKMTIYNRDGSRPQMCGNGVRCVARYLVEQHGAPSRLRLSTDAGPRACEVQVDGDDVSVDVDMGEPAIEGVVEWRGEGRTWRFQPVSMGNPHAVIFEQPNVEVVDAVGEALNSRRVAFSEGVNVEFTRVVDDSTLDVVVYERGVGRTQACGTGACAVAVAAWHEGVIAEGPVEVRLPGGSLNIRMVGGHVWMRGDAEYVMKLQLGPGWLRARTK